MSSPTGNSYLESVDDSTLKCIKAIEPAQFPQLWFTINILCTSLSVYMLCLIVTYDEKEIGVSIFKWPLYNSIVVIIWVYQSMIPVILRGRKALRRLIKKVEMVLVAWYSFDAFITLVANQVMEKTKGRLIVDCCVNITSFLYATFKTISYLECDHQRKRDAARRASIANGIGLEGVAMQGDGDDNESETSELDFFDVICTCQSLTAISCISCITPICDCCC